MDARDAVERELGILTVLVEALKRPHEVTEALWAAETEEMAIEAVRAVFGCDAVEAGAVMDQPWRRLTLQNRLQLADRERELRSRLEQR